MVASLNLCSSNDTGMDSSRSIDYSRQKEKAKPLVLVAWRDILSDDGWTRAKDVCCPTFYSVGWLAYEDEDTIKIASTLDFDDFADEAKGEAMPIPYGITAFPKGCVVEIKYI